MIGWNRGWLYPLLRSYYNADTMSIQPRGASPKLSDQDSKQDIKLRAILDSTLLAGYLSQLPPELVELFHHTTVLFATPRGLCFQDESDQNLYVLEAPQANSLSLRSFTWYQPVGILGPVLQHWILAHDLPARAPWTGQESSGVDRWYLDGEVWLRDALGRWHDLSSFAAAVQLLEQPFQLLLPDMLEAGTCARYLYPDLGLEWFVSLEWDAGLYRRAARAGFISISCDLSGEVRCLCPQLQTEYALLDWTARHIPGRLLRQARNPAMQAVFDSACLVLSGQPAAVVAGIQQRYGELWLCAEYAELLERLASEDDGNFRLVACELRASQEGRLLAGELGYLIGGTYTCLSGFIAEEKSSKVSWGTVQILCLSELLRQRGYSFMNMGQSQPAYKQALGATVLSRLEFLERWLPAVATQPPATPPPGGSAPVGPLELPLCVPVGQLLAALVSQSIKS